MWGIADLMGLAILAVLIIGLRGAALAVPLMAMSPWHLPISRFGHEAITAAATTTLAVALLFAALRLQRGRLLLLSGLMFAISLYSYSITKAFVLPFLVWTAIVYWRELKPLSAMRCSPSLIVVLGTMPQSVAHLAALRRDDGALSLDFGAEFSLAHPIRMFIHGWLFYLTPGFLFLQRQYGPDPASAGLRTTAGGAGRDAFSGPVHPWRSRFRRVTIFLLGWLAHCRPHRGADPAQRPSPAQSADAYAIDPVVSTGHGLPVRFRERQPPGANPGSDRDFAGVVFQGARFVSFYFTKYPALAAYDFQYGLGHAVARASQPRRWPGRDHTYTNQPYIYVLFFTKYPPARFQHEPVIQSQGLFCNGPAIRPLPLQGPRASLPGPAAWDIRVHRMGIPSRRSGLYDSRAGRPAGLPGGSEMRRGYWATPLHSVTSA